MNKCPKENQQAGENYVSLVRDIDHNLGMPLGKSSSSSFKRRDVMQQFADVSFSEPILIRTAICFILDFLFVVTVTDALVPFFCFC
ncbi:hypothetical protein RIF29_29494 [Crotalaria pallida]|uniref:Uncharacterized protein n=1 Tax=Crotalaria pallida TaxID=3830 RepID=A0AAN9I0F7_CROPI